MRSYFLELNDDLLFIIADILHQSDLPRRFDILSLSLVCKQLRRVALTLVFRHVHWPQTSRVDFYPPSLWQYIRQLTLVQTQWPSRHTKAMAILTKILPDMSELTRFNYFAQTYSPTVPFVQALGGICSARLSRLEITTVFLTHSALSSFSIFSGLEHLCIIQPEATSLLSASEPKRVVSVQCVENLIFASQETLRHLELPGEYCPLEALATSKTNFYCMKTFILRDFPPLDAAVVPMWRVLRAMPRLTRLDVACRLRKIGANAQRCVLMHENQTPPPSDSLPYPSQLETLNISNPALNDCIFRHLPHSLRSLCLDFVPDWENMLSSKDSLVYHRPTEIQKLFAVIRKANKPSDLLYMENLTLKMGYCVTPPTLRHIARIFPTLKVLELQGIRYFAKDAESIYGMASYVQSLSILKHIQVLKMAIELEEDNYEYTNDLNRKVGSVDQSAEQWARALAAGILSVRFIAFEVRPHTGKGIGPRPSAAGAGPNWLWFAVEGVDRSIRRLAGLSAHYWGREVQGRRWMLPRSPHGTDSEKAVPHSGLPGQAI